MHLRQGICIHSHFYQPPREDPWLDSILRDPSASPYHDWNECVYEQCYKPYMAARLQDSNGQIVHITSNYRYTSFNVGPTLHSWIDRHAPALAEGIIDADRSARDALGEGGAIAQAYNHMILPLSVERDIKTQVIWGVKDFVYRYGRRPIGMWLPETAVDIPSLEALAAQGINFTILAPYQCSAVRSPGGPWVETPGGAGLDVTRPYRALLPSGSAITLIFYYGSIAHDIAFGGLLDNVDYFAESLLAKLPRDGEPRLLTIATDGETYGHHHRYGEMALAQAAQRLCDSSDTMLTNIASFLKLYPAVWECRISENTSWSCAHGVERWRSDCGCHTGGEPGWNQSWRKPLRDALDKVRDRIDEAYERVVGEFCESPWELRDEAIDLYLMKFGADDSIDTLCDRKMKFLKNYCGELAPGKMKKILSMIEAQRMRMFMYTSCGWFFNDVSGIETRQILAYAIRAIEYVRDVARVDLEADFLRSLKGVPGNTEDLPTAYDVLTQGVIPNKRTMRDVAASTALLNTKGRYHAYWVVNPDKKSYSSGDIDMNVANVNVVDSRTLEEWSGCSVVISTGGLDDVCRLTERCPPDPKEIWKHFYVGDILSTSRYIEDTFEFGPWHFKDLTTDDKDAVVHDRAENVERGHMRYATGLLEENQRLLFQLNLMGVKSSSFLSSAGNFVYSHMLDDLCNDTEHILDLLDEGSKLEALLDEAHNVGIYPSVSVLAPRMESAFYDNLIDTNSKNDESVYKRLLMLWKRAVTIDAGIDKWRLQNVVWAILAENASEPCDSLLEFAGMLGFALPDKYNKHPK
ncbi:MAG: DUF3536 domain-containing protein [Synergistaceae bacterium]|nr:DUF3536 domain-containing protein [Synergistaceae bacterium]